MAQYGNYSVEQRSRSVAALVELFFDVVAKDQPDLFIEAGAKEASASRRARTVCPAATVVAFEANPYTHRRFAAQLDAVGVRYVHQALSDTVGEATFNVLLTEAGDPAADGQGSLLARSSPGRAEMPVTVATIPLDTYLAGHGLAPSATAMWVDVEGATALVLRGAIATLGTAIAVMVEVEERPVWGADQWLAQDVVRWLAGRGLVPVARDYQSRYQHNIIFVRASHVGSNEFAAAYTRWRTSVSSGLRPA